MDYRRLMVRLMKEIVENDYSSIELKDDGEIAGECVYGFITEDSIHIPIPGLEESYREEKQIPKEIPYQKLELGYINDIIITFNKDKYDEMEMEDITDELYHVLGNKFDLMTIEINPV